MSGFPAKSARLQHAVEKAVSATHTGSASSTAGSAPRSAEQVADAVMRSRFGPQSRIRLRPNTFDTTTTDSQPELNPELTNSPGSNPEVLVRSIRIKGSGKRARADPRNPTGLTRRFVSPTRYYQIDDGRPRRLFRMDHVLPEDATIDPERTGLNQKDEVMKRKLQEGYSVMSRELGVPSNSGDWIVHRNDICRFEPVENSSVEIKEGDIVFCEIQSGSIHQVRHNLERKFALQKVLKAVSYTHLTLPTKRIV